MMAQRRISHLRRESASEDGDEIAEERYQLFVSKFHFEKIPIHDSELKNDCKNDGMVRENSTTLPSTSPMNNIRESDDGTDEEATSLAGDGADIENTNKSNDPSATCSSCQPFASLKRVPANKGECVICLDGYRAGDTVCIAVNESCNHIYHRECVVKWLKKNDRCPLCRVDLMK